MFFLNVCENPDILRILYFGLKILDYIFLLIPIGLIIMVIIDVAKVVISGDEKETKTTTKNIVNRVIYTILLFFVPTIVTAVMNILAGSGITSEYGKCIENANKETIQQYQIIKDAKEDALNQQEQVSSGNIYKNLANKMVSVAKNEIPYSAESGKCNKYGKALNSYFPKAGNHNCADWCGVFITWVSKNTTYQNTNLYDDIINKNKNMTRAEHWNAEYLAKHFDSENHLKFNKSKSHGGTYTPKPGDYIFIDWDARSWDGNMSGSTPIQHVGMVVEVSNGYVHTIEGNTDGGNGKLKYRKKELAINSNQIAGYGSWYNN